MIAELQTFFIAMTPIGELRASIPIALWTYNLPVWSALLFSILGNLVPVIILLYFLEPLSRYLSHQFYFFNRFFNWLFERTRRKHSLTVERWKEFALVMLVAIPLPFTGAWTGAIVAFVFKIPFRVALTLIFFGIVIAGLIMTLLTLGIIQII